jgi:hypothetical protein
MIERLYELQIHEYFRAKDEAWTNALKRDEETEESLKSRYRFMIPSAREYKHSSKGLLQMTPAEIIPRLGPFLVSKYRIRTKKKGTPLGPPRAVQLTRASSCWVLSMQKLIKELSYPKAFEYGNNRHGVFVDESFVSSKEDMVIPFVRDTFQVIQMRCVCSTFN